MRVERVENWSQFIFLGEPMVARDAVIHPANLLVVFQIWKAFRFCAESNPLRKNAGEKQRLIADVGA